MNTVKTTLIVIATIVGAYLLFDFVSGVYFAVQDKKHQQEAFHADLNLDSKIQELAKPLIGKKVKINSWDNATYKFLDVPVWRIYKQSTAGTLSNGDYVTLLDIDVDSNEGKNAKIRTKNGLVGYITYWYIDEFEEAKKIDPLLNTEK